MGTEKRERQKASRAARIEVERAAEKKSEALLRGGRIVAIVAVVLFVLYLVSVFTGNDDEPAEAEVVPTTELATAAVIDTEPVAETTPVTVRTDGTACPAEDGSAEHLTDFDAPFNMCIDPSRIYVAEVITNKGTVVIELDAQKAPDTVNNFVSLARHHFYDGVAFHRIIPGFMIQGGDAVGVPAGIGGPGYKFDDELPQAGDYQVGSLAMANSGPDTQGSQFFIITGDAGVNLPPAYSLFGVVTEGMEAVSAIESTGSASGAPSDSSVIESITITEQ